MHLRISAALFLLTISTTLALRIPFLFRTPQKVIDPICDLPGDPSLVLSVNVDLGEQKVPIMKVRLEGKQRDRNRRIVRDGQLGRYELLKIIPPPHFVPFTPPPNPLPSSAFP